MTTATMTTNRDCTMNSTARAADVLPRSVPPARWTLGVRSRLAGAVAAAATTWALLAGVGHIADAQFEASAGGAAAAVQWAGHVAEPRG